MKNKMIINTYLSTIESKKQTKQTRTQTESWIMVMESVLMIARQEGIGEEMRELRSTNC